MAYLIAILCLAMIAGVLFVVSIRDSVKKGYEDYEDRTIGQLKEGLADNLLFINPEKLFFITLILTVVISVSFYFLFGFFFAAVAALIAVLLPRLMLKILKTKRDKRFTYQLPDCLSTLAMSLRAGSNLSRAMTLVVEQQPAPISQEFAIVVSDVKMGQQIEDALTRMYQRVESTEVELFTSAVAISRSVGGNLADTMETLSDTIRERLQIEGKIKALTAMGKAQGVVVGAVPIGMLAVLYNREPEAMHALFTTVPGWWVCALLVIMGVLAFVIIRKIVNIDV